MEFFNQQSTNNTKHQTILNKQPIRRTGVLRNLDSINTPFDRIKP
jgi:hypothetical protein